MESCSFKLGPGTQLGFGGSALSAQLLPARNLEVGDLHWAANFRVSRSNSSALPQNMGVLLYYLFSSAGFKELGNFSG